MKPRIGGSLAIAAVLDASAMIAFLRGETGADIVERALDTNSGSLCTAHAINVCEV